MSVSPQIEEAVRVLQGGGLVAFPTETVYGLGALIRLPRAVAQVFAAKARPHFDPLIVHVLHAAQAETVAEVPASQRRRFETLARAFWPGPLTLLLPKRAGVPDLVTSGLPTVGVRVPAHPRALELLAAVGEPICAPSANPFGRLSPTTAEHVRAGLGDRVDLILDGGACAVGVESTILSLAGDAPEILRPGGVPHEAIEAALGETVAVHADSAARIQAPGQLDAHYAPRTPLSILPARATGGRLGLLAFSRPRDGYAAVEILSESRDLNEAAVRLFACLHRLDAAGLDGIEVEAVPETGLGLAIMNRLRKAAHSTA